MRKLPKRLLSASVLLGLLTGCTYASQMIGAELPGASGPGGGQTGTAQLPVVREVPEIAAMVPDAVRADGVLTIATELTYAPMGFVGADGRSAMGMDIDIANAVAAVMGLTPQNMSSSFDAIIPSLGTRYELGISAFTVTSPRIDAVNMISYLEAGSQLAVRVGNPDGVNPDDLCGVAIAVQIGTVQQEDLEVMNRGVCSDNLVNIFPYDSQADATANLVGGRVAAMFADSPIIGYAVTQTGGALMELGPIMDAAPYGMVVAKPDVKFAKAVHAAVQHLIDSGAMAQIAAHWGNSQMLITQSELFTRAG